MNNIENIREMEEAMNAHRAEMQKINKFFSVIYLLCMVPNLIIVILGLAIIVVMVVTLGTVGYVITPTMALKWFASIGAVILFGMSNSKYKKCTYWSVAILLFMSLLVVIDGMIPVMYPIQAALQCLCIKKYDRVDYLKAQQGYPDFNPVMFVSAVADTNRRLDDNEVKALLSQNRENRQAIRIEDVPDEMPGLEVPDENEYLTEREIADRKMNDIFKE